MPAGDPKRPLPFPFRDLTDDEFDELVYLVAHVTDPKVLKTRAPDGGLDTVRLSTDDPLRASWGIQAKLHRDHISWTKCEESLDRAVDQWKPPRVTFAFPRDLTVGQHKNLVKHLSNRHDGVEVDWWGATKLTAVMTGSDGGKAIAKRFFYVEDPADIVDRATRAGGPLRTPADLLDREGAIGDFLRTGGPHFDFQMTNRPKSEEELPRTPNAAMRLEFLRDDQQLIVDAVPRTTAALEHYGPRITVDLDDQGSANALLGKVQNYGGRATLGQGKITFERIPPPFDQILSEVEGVISVRAQVDPPPWAAHLTADSDQGNGTLNVDLAPATPESDWDGKLVGQHNGVTVEMRFAWSHSEAKGRIVVTWHFARATGSADERAGTLAFVVALHGKGTWSIADRESRRMTLSEPTVPQPVPSGLSQLRDFYRNLADIQDFAGATFGPPPDDVSAEGAYNVAHLAELLRCGKVNGTVTSSKMTIGAEGLAQFRRSGSNIQIREKLFADLFGHQVHVADRIMHLPPMQVRNPIRRSEGWEIDLVPTAGDQAPMEIEFLPPT